MSTRNFVVRHPEARFPLLIATALSILAAPTLLSACAGNPMFGAREAPSGHPTLNSSNSAVNAPPGASAGKPARSASKQADLQAIGDAAGLALSPDGPMTSPFSSDDQVRSLVAEGSPSLCTPKTTATKEQVAFTLTDLLIKVGKGGLSSESEAAGLQSRLAEVLPQLRALSLHTIWLPVEAERLVGEFQFARDRYPRFEPTLQQRVIVERTIRPLFQQLESFLLRELKSGAHIELRIVRSKATSLYSLHGGIIVVPSGMLDRLRKEPAAEPVVATLLAHEIAHVLLRHKTRVLQLGLLQALAVPGELIGMARDVKGNPNGASSLAEGLAEGVSTLLRPTCDAQDGWQHGLEADQEHEADACGAVLVSGVSKAIGRRINSVASVEAAARWMPGASATLAPKHATRGTCSVATHPPVAERLQNLRSYVQEPTAVGKR